jgi:Domain of unknown function (DUF5004)
MKARNKFFIPCILLLLTIWASCKVDRVVPVNEAVKDISGTWQVIKATRNGTDITNYNGVDFSKFNVVFKAGTYTLNNRLPFLTDTGGTYKLNDPQYPMQISFTPTGGQAVQTDFVYPIVTGVRNINLTFSANPGCNSNSYIYTLQKVN